LHKVGVQSAPLSAGLASSDTALARATVDRGTFAQFHASNWENAKMANLKRNDVVQPLQGGPRMTIDKMSTTAGNVTATCIWIDEKEDKRQQAFRVSELKLIG
jgi:uncharacterized protein YodC (DUF2158 family)